MRSRAEVLTGAWFRYFMEFDPSTALRDVSCPVLAMVGDKDIQVDAGMNMPAIEKALREGGNEDYRIAVMPGLKVSSTVSRTFLHASATFFASSSGSPRDNVLTSWV